MGKFNHKIWSLFLAAGVLASSALLPMAASAAESFCAGSKCAVPVIKGAKCILAGVTNGGYTWNVSMSDNADGSNPFWTGYGTGADNTPMKWKTGNALFTAKSDRVYVSYSVNESNSVRLKTSVGFTNETSGALMTGEDLPNDDSFNDAIVWVNCSK